MRIKLLQSRVFGSARQNHRGKCVCSNSVIWCKESTPYHLRCWCRLCIRCGGDAVEACKTGSRLQKKKHCKYFVTDRWRIKPKPTHSNPFKVFVPKPKSQLFSAVLHLMEYSYNSKTEATLSYLFTEQTKQTFSIHILAF